MSGARWPKVRCFAAVVAVAAAGCGGEDGPPAGAASGRAVTDAATANPWFEEVARAA